MQDHADTAFRSDAPSAAAPELPRSDTLLRLFYSAVLAVLLHVVLCILTLLIVLQLVLALVNCRKPPMRLQAFGAELTGYCASVFRYLTFGQDEPPFPFSDLPAGA